MHIYTIKTGKFDMPEVLPQKLDEKPAIAVLPFENVSADPERDYFADGITEDVITALSYWRWFPVIARNSTQAYKGKTGDATTIGKELGARYLVQGSVRRGGDAVRVSVHLIDASNGHEVWAERYDRRMEDMFALQDEITERIVTGIEPRLHRAEEMRAVLKRPKDRTSWDHILRATRAKAMGGHGYGTKESNDEARQHLLRAKELEPTSAEALARLAQCEWHDAITGWAEDHNAGLGDQGLSNFLLGNYDKSIQYLTEAATTQPDYVRSRQRLVASLEAAGRSDEARTELEELKKIQPTLSLDYINTTYPLKSDADRERFVNALRNAGLD